MFKKKRKSKRFIIHKVTIFFLLFIMVLFLTSRLYFRPPIMAYAKQKSYYYASILINDAISKQIVPNIDTSKLILLNTKSNGYVSSVIVDMHQINDLLAKLTKEIQVNLLELESDESNQLHQLKMPIGVMFDNPILSRLGPDLSIKLKLVGSVLTDIVSSVEPYGINNSLIKIVIQTKVRFQVMIPFQRGEIEIVANTPLLLKIIQGDVPHYYYSGGTGSFSNPPKDDTTNPPTDNEPIDE